ncbi:MAG: protein kinase [Anaerolineae bacterium]|nr:protein kinase [Anaerolineae bacterium]
MAEKLGRYEILEELGQGGFAIVHRGCDTILDRPVALKELRPVLLNDAEWVARFHREAKTIARLDHPHIVPIYDVYETNQRLFIIMRLVDGPSLEEIIHTKGHLPWPEALEIFTTITEGLAYAHSQHILHRDLKPANILIDSKQGAMLSDFGLAKLTSESSMSLSASGTIVGTPHYIAPEIWEGKPSSPQSDIYALGCIVYETLTGEKIFKGDTPPAVMMAHFTPLSLPQIWPDGIPVGIAGVLGKALARSPEDRYAHADELLAELTALQTNGAARTPQPTASASTPPAPTAIGDSAPMETVVIPEQERVPTAPPTDRIAVEAINPIQKKSLSVDIPVSRASVVAPTEPPPAVAPPADNAGSTSAPPHPRQRRRGCLWLGVGAVALVLIGVMGLGNFCSLLSKLNTNHQVEADLIDLTTEPISVPFPSDTDTAEVDIDFGAGELFINPGAEDALISGTATYNVAQLKPTIAIDQEKVSIKPVINFEMKSLPNDEIHNRWELNLGDFPMELTLNAGASNSTLELGGLSLEQVRVAGGATDFALSFKEPNKVPMESLRFTGAGSKTELTGLANAHTEDILFKGGAGEYLLDFSGVLQDDIDVEVDAGLGQVTLRIPEQVRASVTVRDFLSSVEPTGGWQQAADDENVYKLAGDVNSDHEIEITVRIGGGTLRLETLYQGGEDK